MTADEILGVFREHGLHAFQAEFAAHFLRDESPPHHMLVAPDGLGRVSTGSLLTAQMIQQRQIRRVLVVAPASAALMWRKRMEQLEPGIPVTLVHGRAFRDLRKDLDAWPEAILVVMPTDTARQPDVASALTETCWDLAVFVEPAHRADRDLVGLIEYLFASEALKRSLVLTGRCPEDFEPDPGASDTPTRSFPEYCATKWLGELDDWEGAKTSLPRLEWKTVPFTRDEHEVRFLRMLREKCELTKASGSPFYFQTDVLMRRAKSSLFAAEQTLRIVSRKLSQVHGRPKLATVPEENYNSLYEIEDATGQSMTSAARQAYLQFLVEADRAAAHVTSDEKTSRLLRLLEDLSEDPSEKTCVLAAYSDTVSYLLGAISEVGTAARAATTRGLPYARRQEVIRDFLREGGILLTTIGALAEETELGRVRHVVHYDTPTSAARLSQVEGRFRRLDREVPCTMYAMADQSLL